MKIAYDWEKRIKTCVCQACGYRHSAEMNYTRSTLEGDDEFIEMEGFELHSTDDGGWYPSHNTHTIYACPKCGVLQIEV